MKRPALVQARSIAKPPTFLLGAFLVRLINVIGSPAYPCANALVLSLRCLGAALLGIKAPVDAVLFEEADA